MTDNHNTLCYQIRIDKLVDKWSGSIEIGVTTHNPNNLDYPATMTNLRSGKARVMTRGSLFVCGKLQGADCFCFFKVQS